MFLEKKIFNLLSGGAKKNTKNGYSMFLIFIIAIISILIRVLIVRYCYNSLVPKLVLSLNSNPQKAMQNFVPLNFSDALLLVILISVLLMR